MATYGVGILIGSLVAGPIVDRATADGHDWPQIWVVPAIIAGVVLLLFLLLFKDRRVVEQATVYDELKTTLEAPRDSRSPGRATPPVAAKAPSDRRRVLSRIRES